MTGRDTQRRLWWSLSYAQHSLFTAGPTLACISTCVRNERANHWPILPFIKDTTICLALYFISGAGIATGLYVLSVLLREIQRTDMLTPWPSQPRVEGDEAEQPPTYASAL